MNTMNMNTNSEKTKVDFDLLQKFYDFLMTKGLQGILNVYSPEEADFLIQVGTLIDGNLVEFMEDLGDQELAIIHQDSNGFTMTIRNFILEGAEQGTLAAQVVTL